MRINTGIWSKEGGDLLADAVKLEEELENQHIIIAQVMANRQERGGSSSHCGL